MREGNSNKKIWMDKDFIDDRFIIYLIFMVFYAQLLFIKYFLFDKKVHAM